MLPRAYSTPLIFVFQIGFRNQMANRSIFNPRQRAARKWPSSWTKMSRLKSNSTSRAININFNMDIRSANHPKNGAATEYSSKPGRGNAIPADRAPLGKQDLSRHRKGDPYTIKNGLAFASRVIWLWAVLPCWQSYLLATALAARSELSITHLLPSAGRGTVPKAPAVNSKKLCRRRPFFTAALEN